MSFQFGVIRGDLNCRGYWQAVGVALPKIKNLKKPNLTFQNNNLTIRQAEGTTLSRNRVLCGQWCFFSQIFQRNQILLRVSAPPRCTGFLRFFSVSQYRSLPSGPPQGGQFWLLL